MSVCSQRRQRGVQMNASFSFWRCYPLYWQCLCTLGSQNLKILISNQRNQVLFPYPSHSAHLPLQTPNWSTRGNTILSTGWLLLNYHTTKYLLGLVFLLKMAQCFWSYSISLKSFAKCQFSGINTCHHFCFLNNM